jgi:hypothetical protein
MRDNNVIKLATGSREANKPLDVKTILTEFFKSVDMTDILEHQGNSLHAFIEYYKRPDTGDVLAEAMEDATFVNHQITMLLHNLYRALTKNQAAIVQPINFDGHGSSN